MATATVETRYTPEDLLTMPDEGRFELIDGQLVERNMGAKSSYVATKLVSRIEMFCDKQDFGLVFQSDCGYQIFKPNRDRVRYADGSFIRTGRLPNNEPPNGHCRIAPDLVIEAVSPNDTAPEIEQKVEEWLSAGVRLVWVLFPNTQCVYVHREDGTVSKLGTAAELSGEKVLPAFKCRVATIFKLPQSKARRGTKR